MPPEDELTKEAIDHSEMDDDVVDLHADVSDDIKEDIAIIQSAFSQNADDDEKDAHSLKKNRYSITFGKQPDRVASQYDILLDQHLAEFDTPFCTAYNVHDKKFKRQDELYCLVFKKELPLPLHAIEKLVDFSHENFCNVLAAEIITLSTNNEKNLVAIVERPRGMKLSEYILSLGHQLPEELLNKRIITPLNSVLSRLEAMGVVHGCINLDTIFITNEGQIIVSECISEPTGFSQKYIYESVERAASNPAGKGTGTSAVDYYAFGVLLLHIMHQGKFGNENNSQIHALKLHKTSYNALIRNLKVNPIMLDILVGLLNDRIPERWDGEKVALWLKGKRFNLVVPKNNIESTRPFTFQNVPYFNCTSLAYALYSNWDEAKKILQTDMIVKWIERSVQDPRKAFRLSNIARLLKTAPHRNLFPPEDELVARSIITLDPSGPIRLQGFCVNIDGIGPLLAYSHNTNNRDIVQTIGIILQNNLAGDWVENNSDTISADESHPANLAAKLSSIITKKSIGFGIERCFYDLNPSLICQSPLLIDKYVLSLSDFLIMLNKIAKDHKGPLLDRHSAAYISSALDLPNELNLKGLSKFPKIMKITQLQMLGLLTIAQERTGIYNLKNLAQKLNIQLSAIVDTFHSKTIREDLRKNLEKVAKQGNLHVMLGLTSDGKLFAKDKGGFSKAVDRYRLLEKRISKIDNKTQVTSIAYRYGLQLSVISSYLIAAIVVIVLFARSGF